MNIKIYTFFVLCVVSAAGASCATEQSLVVRSYSITSEKITGGSSVRIAVLADTHSQLFKHGAELIAEKLREANADILVFAGDIVDDKKPLEGTELLLRKVLDGTPAYYVSGNHEYGYPDVDRAFKLIRAFGVTHLFDEWTEITVNGTVLLIAGADDPIRTRLYDGAYNRKESTERAFAPLRLRPEFKILIVHKPPYTGSFSGFGFDLIISGHTHGGQVRIPNLVNGLYSPGQGIFPRFAGGSYRLPGPFGPATMIVSRGLATRSPWPRVFNPPELVIIDIQNK